MTEQRAPVTFKQFARILGERSPSYVTELNKAGRLVLTDDGKRVRVAESLELIRSTADPAKAGVVARHAAERGQAAPTPPVAPQPAPGAPDAAGEPDAAPFAEPPPADPVEASHARRRAKALADKAETDALVAQRDYQLSLGELLKVADVEQLARTTVTTFRTSLENLPNTLAPELAATADEGRVRVVLGEALEHLLEELARKFGALAQIDMRGP